LKRIVRREPDRVCAPQRATRNPVLAGPQEPPHVPWRLNRFIRLVQLVRLVARFALRRLLVVAGLLICGWLLSGVQSAHAADRPPGPATSMSNAVDAVRSATEQAAERQRDHTGGHTASRTSASGTAAHSSAQSSAGSRRALSGLQHAVTSARTASKRAGDMAAASPSRSARTITPDATTPDATTPGTAADAATHALSARAGDVGAAPSRSARTTSPGIAPGGPAAGALRGILTGTRQAVRRATSAGDVISTGVPTGVTEAGLSRAVRRAGPAPPGGAEPGRLADLPASTLHRPPQAPDPLPALDALPPPALDPLPALAGLPPPALDPLAGPGGLAILPGPVVTDVVGSATGIVPLPVGPVGVVSAVAALGGGQSGVLSGPLLGTVTSSLSSAALQGLVAPLDRVLGQLNDLAVQLIPRLLGAITPITQVLAPIGGLALSESIVATPPVKALIRPSSSVADGCATVRPAYPDIYSATGPVDWSHVTIGGSAEQTVANAPATHAEPPLAIGPHDSAVEVLCGQWPQPRQSPGVPAAHMSGQGNGPLTPGEPNTPLSGGSTRALPSSSQNDGTGDTPASWQARVTEAFVPIRIAVPLAIRTAADEPAFSPD
jgi:hypothetical protein